VDSFLAGVKYFRRLTERCDLPTEAQNRIVARLDREEADVRTGSFSSYELDQRFQKLNTWMDHELFLLPRALGKAQGCLTAYSVGNLDAAQQLGVDVAFLLNYKGSEFTERYLTKDNVRERLVEFFLRAEVNQKDISRTQISSVVNHICEDPVLLSSSSGLDAVW